MLAVAVFRRAGNARPSCTPARGPVPCRYRSAGELPASQTTLTRYFRPSSATTPCRSTLQMVADIIVSSVSLQGGCHFLLSGPRFQIGSGSGIAQAASRNSFCYRMPRLVLRRGRRSRLLHREEIRPRTSRRLGQILDSGVKLCLASAVDLRFRRSQRSFHGIRSAAGPWRTKRAQETIQSLCDLARLAIEHGQLYEAGRPWMRKSTG